MTEIQNAAGGIRWAHRTAVPTWQFGVLSCFRHSDFGFWICFGFRISNLGLVSNQE